MATWESHSSLVNLLDAHFNEKCFNPSYKESEKKFEVCNDASVIYGNIVKMKFRETVEELEALWLKLLQTSVHSETYAETKRSLYNGISFVISASVDKHNPYVTINEDGIAIWLECKLDLIRQIVSPNDTSYPFAHKEQPVIEGLYEIMDSKESYKFVYVVPLFQPYVITSFPLSEDMNVPLTIPPALYINAKLDVQYLINKG